VRIEIEGPGDVLRRALADLVRAAGHEVVSADADLRILVGAAERDSEDGRTTLWLSPPADQAVDPDPAAALERVLGAGGLAVWGDPFDPALLLEGLSGTRPRPAETPTAAPSSAVPFDTAPDPWFGVDPIGRRILWANAAATRALGTSPSRGDSTPLPGLDRLFDVLARLEGRDRVEVSGRSWSASWWTDASGARVVGLADVPALARPSAQARSLADLERMSATLAHELRNPVAGFAGALDLLSEDLAPSDRREVAALARSRVDQMRLLLDDTLRLARPFKGPPVPVECALVVRSAVAGVGTDPLFAGVDVRVRIEDESVRVLGYEQPLRQAVTNLLVNAAQAQAGKGVVDVSLRREGAHATLRVADEGPGIPEEIREKVFEAFWTTKKSGTGLGLAYVRRVAEACGGSVRVEGAPVRGACLVLDLSLAPTPPP
jgi:signal transduction histidine kinase